MIGPVAFVLGGGGLRGAVEVGMLQALLERQVRPDLIVGTSIGAVNGAQVAADPTTASIERLRTTWLSDEASAIYGDGIMTQARRLIRTRTHLISPEPLRHLLEQQLGGVRTFEELEVPLRVVAASIERAAEHVFDEGPLVDAILASAAVPGLFPAAQVDGEHFIDGGIVNSIPISHAVAAGARTIFVLQVGRVEEPLSPPRTPTDAARVAFEIARRHRFAWDLANLPDEVTVHVLPSGGSTGKQKGLRAFQRPSTVLAQTNRAYHASLDYLDRLNAG